MPGTGTYRESAFAPSGKSHSEGMAPGRMQWDHHSEGLKTPTQTKGPASVGSKTRFIPRPGGLHVASAGEPARPGAQNLGTVPLSFRWAMPGRPVGNAACNQPASQPAPSPQNQPTKLGLGPPKCDHFPSPFSFWEEPRRAPALWAASRKGARLCHPPSQPICVTGPRERLQRGVLSAGCNAATLRDGRLAYGRWSAPGGGGGCTAGVEGLSVGRSWGRRVVVGEIRSSSSWFSFVIPSPRAAMILPCDGSLHPRTGAVALIRKDAVVRSGYQVSPLILGRYPRLVRTNCRSDFSWPWRV